ncbi:MAG: radical SAM protein [Fibromonadales bacterium]|nr:radical SAM protein [Fibromonadales bacterium]
MAIAKMNLVSKLHQPCEVNYIESLNLDDYSSNPHVVELDTTEICNLACRGCISEDMLHTRNSFSEDRLLRLGEELFEAEVKAVILIGGGEPLCNHAVGSFMTYLGERDVQIGLTTNGTLIDRYMEIIAQYVSWTRVSMDAATEGTFGMLRPAKNGKSLFNKIIDNMSNLAKIKKGKLGYSFLIRTKADGFSIDTNIDEIYAAAKLAKEIGCDYFELKPSYKFTDNSDHYLIKHEQADMDRAKAELMKCQELSNDKFKVITSVNLEHSLNGLQSLQPKEYHLCPSAYMRTLICSSGVYVCPYFRGKKHMIVGDVSTRSFKEVWNSEQRKKVMQMLDPALHCKMHCIRHDTNLEVLRMKKEQDFRILAEKGDRFI